MIAVIDYNAGNVYSVVHALRRLQIESVLTKDKAILRSADKIIFPGVGEAKSTMDYLRKHQLDELIRDLKQPVLGICLGMQLMCRYSEEGDSECLGIFDISVKKFIRKKSTEKIPHMGWNTLMSPESDLYKDIGENEYVYFVHSYYVPVNEYTTAVTHHIHDFSASLKKENFCATQFHPEKSGDIGEKILKNFLTI